MDMSRFYATENEKPLDRIVDDGGFCKIFRTIGVIGDSLADFNHLALGNGQFTDDLFRINVDFQPFKYRLGFVVHLFAVDGKVLVGCVDVTTYHTFLQYSFFLIRKCL